MDICIKVGCFKNYENLRMRRIIINETYQKNFKDGIMIPTQHNIPILIMQMVDLSELVKILTIKHFSIKTVLIVLVKIHQQILS